MLRYPDDYIQVSIHAFRGEGDKASVFKSDVDDVSIHAFRGEGDRAGTA